MSKKNLPKKQTTSKSGAHAADRKRLARDLSAVLNNPAITVGLYNDITEAILSLAVHMDYDTPELIELALIGADEFSRKGWKR